MDFVPQITGAVEDLKSKATEVLDRQIDTDARVEQIQKDVRSLEARMNRPQRSRAANGDYVAPEKKAHAAAFEAWLRNPKSDRLSAALRQAESDALPDEVKQASGLTDAAGGAFVPEIISGQIVTRMRDSSAVRGIASVNAVDSGDIQIPVRNNNASSGWVGETDPRPDTAEPNLEPRKPTFGSIYAYVEATEELVMDSMFDLGAYFTQAVADEIAISEGAAFTTGDGVKKPTGMLFNSPESGLDDDIPARAPGAYRYIPTGVLGGFDATSPADVLYTTIYDLKSQYRSRARWLMNSATAGVIRKWKDADGRYLWADTIAPGQPPLLAGYPVSIDETMPDIFDNFHPILFGDFMLGYGIYDVGGLRITVDDNITKPGFVRWYIRKRVGGCVLDNNAVRAIKCSAS